MQEKVESNWLKGGPSYKCARVHNNSKSEDLILKQKEYINTDVY